MYVYIYIYIYTYNEYISFCVPCDFCCGSFVFGCNVYALLKTSLYSLLVLLFTPCYVVVVTLCLLPCYVCCGFIVFEGLADDDARGEGAEGAERVVHGLELYVYIYIYIYICVCIYIYMCTYVHAYIYTCIHVYVHTHIYIYIYIEREGYVCIYRCEGIYQAG